MIRLASKPNAKRRCDDSINPGNSKGVCLANSFSLFRKSVALAVEPNIVSNAKVLFCSKELNSIPVATIDLPIRVKALIAVLAALASPTPIAVLMV